MSFKYSWLILFAFIFLHACNEGDEKNQEFKGVEIKKVDSYDIDRLFGVKCIINTSNGYYIISWGNDELLKMSDGKLMSFTSTGGDGSSAFKSPPQSLIKHNNLIYVLERDSRVVNRYNLDLEPIDQIKFNSQFPKSRSLELIHDSLLVISSLLPHKYGLSLYDSDLNHLQSIDLKNEVGYDLWDIKEISVIDDKIIVGYPFSGRVEILKSNGELIKKFDTGAEILNINVPDPNQDLDGNLTMPSGLNFLSIQALNNNYIILFTPQKEEKYHEIYFLNMEGQLIGKAYLDGLFQFIHPLDSKIYGFNQNTEMIEIYEYSLNP